MNVKNIIKVVALAMLMPAMLLNSACSNEDEPVIDNENAPTRGYPLYVSVNATRQGDAGTNRATYNESTRKLEFSDGDKLLVNGSATGAGSFAGMLDYVSEGTFSGTIYTQKEYSGTADALFTAANSDRVEALLFPNGYESYGFLSLTSSGYSTSYIMSLNNAIAATKAAAVEQLSFETAETYSSGFALSPQNAILNFTITGLTDGDKDVTLKNGSTPMFVGSVTPTSGTATFALGAGIVDVYSSPVNLKNVILTIGDTDIDITDADNNLTAGKIYNIKRCAGAINGKFSVSDTKQVYFSKGNLQATTTDFGANWTWAFAAHQWDYVGSAAANTSMKTDGTGTVTANGTVDLFGWVGASSSWTSAAKWGISASTTSADYGTDNDEALKSDWGNVPGIGSGWYTLSLAEWNYLFNTRSATTVNGVNDARYAKAIVNGEDGIVLFPDSYTHPTGVTAPNSINSDNISFANAHNTWSGDDWTKMEKAGCVFLPAGGNRIGMAMTSLGGYYWTSTSYEGYAYNVYYTMKTVNTSTSKDYRYKGQSVRLVRDAN